MAGETLARQDRPDTAEIDRGLLCGSQPSRQATNNQQNSPFAFCFHQTTATCYPTLDQHSQLSV
jgi:hypothetical protein